MQQSRNIQRVGGLLIALVGAGFTWFVWRDAINTGFFSVRGALIFPAFFVIGMALVVIPGYKEERRARGEDLTGISGWRLITARWWVVIALALGAGALNLVLLRG